MAQFEDVKQGFALLAKEVGETADQVKALRDEIAALIAAFPTMTQQEIEAELGGFVTKLNEAAKALDKLQDVQSIPDETPA